jgi:hypothetical protein
VCHLTLDASRHAPVVSGLGGLRVGFDGGGVGRQLPGFDLLRLLHGLLNLGGACGWPSTGVRAVPTYRRQITLRV